MDLEKNLERVKPKIGLDKLPEILSFLKSEGMNLAIDNIKIANNYLHNIGVSLPLVRDGFDGIRADYDKKNDKLTIWFTNGFEDLNNEKRKEIEKWLKNNFS